MDRITILVLCCLAVASCGSNNNGGLSQSPLGSLSAKAKELFGGGQQETSTSANKDLKTSSSTESQSLDNSKNIANSTGFMNSDVENVTDETQLASRIKFPKIFRSSENDSEVCFGGLGCFSMEKPWKTILRPIGEPYHPKDIQTKIYFYSRINLEIPTEIQVYPDIDMGNSTFDASKTTVMIIHGFASEGNATWMRNIKDVYLRKFDANVMLVDWGKGAGLTSYLQVAANTRVVGRELSLFVTYLQKTFGANVRKFHLIGHSLGAQIASYVGRDVRGIARLTALDPAQPGFEGFNAEVRLDTTDAKFVEVLHTDAKPFLPTLGFGMVLPVGHVDIYFNGGFEQPGCLTKPLWDFLKIENLEDLAKVPVEILSEMISCSHSRAYEYLLEAYNKTDGCTFWGHKPKFAKTILISTNALTQGLLKKFTNIRTPCTFKNCIPIGFETIYSRLRGIFITPTSTTPPYCIPEEDKEGNGKPEKEAQEESSPLTPEEETPEESSQPTLTEEETPEEFSPSEPRNQE